MNTGLVRRAGTGVGVARRQECEAIKGSKSEWIDEARAREVEGSATDGAHRSIRCPVTRNIE
jgi:hypothetical protein